MIKRGITAFLFSIFILNVGQVLGQDGSIDTMRIEIDDFSGRQGETVCVDFTVQNFTNIQTMQFSLHFDPTVVEPICPPTDLNLPGLSPVNFNCAEINEGHITALWVDPQSGQNCGESLNDGEVLFNLCFVLTGDPGTTSPIYVAGDQLDQEYSFIPDCDSVNTFLTVDDIPSSVGELIIECGSLSLFTNKCDSETTSNTGLISFYACGGSAPYSYSVNSGQFTGTITNEREEVFIENLSPGTYDIEITDNMGSSSITTVNIATGPALDVSVDITPPSCWDRGPGRGNGSIEITDITGGTGPYMVVWDNFNFQEWPNPDPSEPVNYTRLHNDTYGVTITDVNGCSISREYEVFVDTLRVEAEIISNATCEGSSDGIVRLTASGGTPFPDSEYSFNGSTPTDDFIDNMVPEGWYDFTVRDGSASRCEVEDSIFVPANESLLPSSISVTNICGGQTDVEFGGFSIFFEEEYDFDWVLLDENGNEPAHNPRQNRFSYIIDSLTAGQWFFTATDDLSGCSFSYDFEVVDLPAIVITDDTSNPTCLGNDGSIEIMASGGTGGFTYTWSDGNTDSLRTDLIGGMYSLTVSDDNGCQETATFDLPSADGIVIDVQVSQEISCNGTSDGELGVVVSSSGEFAYRWYQGTDTLGTSSTISGLSAGTYYILVRDVNLPCFTIDSVVLSNPDSILIDVNYSLPTCPFPEFTDGFIGVSPAAGLGPYTYLWDDGSTESVRASISAGDYAVTISNAGGCQLDTVLTLENPDRIEVDVFNITGINCFGTATGSAEAFATGGTENTGIYNYFWSSGPIDDTLDARSSIASNLSAGLQYVIATDAQCPSDTIFFEVPDIAPIQLDMDQSTLNQPSCFDECDGSFTAVAMGGNTNSYSYLWTFDNSNNPTIRNLCDGKYFVEITDANNCTNLDSVIITHPDSLSVVIDPNLTIDPICFNNGEAQLGVMATGGTPDYQYSWSDNVSTSNIADELPDGTYTITVTDANNCTDVTSYEMTSPEAIEAIIPQPDQPQCFGGRTCITVESATGGSGEGYTFTVNRGIRFPIDSCLNVFAGPYTVTVFDSEGCNAEYQVEITQPEPITVDLGEDLEVSLGEETPPISADISSVFPIEVIGWDPIDSLRCLTSDCQVISVTPTQTSTYNVTVIDENGCMGRDDISIVVNKKRNVYAANIFSPNQDGFNDHFQLVIGPGVEMVEEFYIFDRWGNKVWEQTDYLPEESGNDGWDGNLNGQPAQSGVYGYVAIVKFIDDDTVTFKGDITLIR